MKGLLSSAILILFTCYGYSQTNGKEFVFPSKEGKFDLLSSKGLVQKNQSTTFEIRSNQGVDLYDVTVIALNASIAQNGEQLVLNVATENLIYLLFLITDEVNGEFKYLDLVGVPVADSPYPYITVYADNVPVNPQRGIQGNTSNLKMALLYDDLKGSCQRVFVNQIAVSFTDRQREVGSVRKEGDSASISSLLSRGASSHLHIEVKAEAIACVDDKGVLRVISPKIKRSFTYGITSLNLDRDITQVISHMNAENKKQARANGN